MTKDINTSGLIPIEYKVVILQDNVEKITEGGIIIPETTLEREQQAETTGTLLAVGGMAFTDSDWGEWKGAIPKSGDRVLVAKYAGYFFTGIDGQIYQCCQDKDIAGVWKKTERTPKNEKEKKNARTAGK